MTVDDDAATPLLDRRAANLGVAGRLSRPFDVTRVLALIERCS